MKQDSVFDISNFSNALLVVFFFNRSDFMGISFNENRPKLMLSLNLR